MKNLSPSAPDTLLTHAGSDPLSYAGYVNPPIFRGSTILAENLTSWEAAQRDGNPYSHYGRFGSPTSHAFEDAIAELEGGMQSQVFPSGLSACTHTLLAMLDHGDHLLITDNVYGPTRAFAEDVLPRFGIHVTFFDPLCGSNIRELMTPQTRMVYLESPGSQSFEVCDMPAIAEVAHAQGALIATDNSWASPLYFKPFEHGADISIQAATKYILGHSDALLGVVTANEKAWERLQKGFRQFGETAGPDDVYLALRGLRTLSVRLRQHAETGLLLAHAMAKHPAVSRVLHPGLADDPGHIIWKRDFLGASGLFGFILASEDKSVLKTFFDALQYFGIGLSWGGFESLAIPVGQPKRTAQPWTIPGTLIRVHAGLDDPQDLLRDMCHALDQAWQAMPQNASTRHAA